MPRSSSRSVSKTPPASEKRVTRGRVQSPAAKSSTAAKSPAKSAMSPASSRKKSAAAAPARSRSRNAAASQSPKKQREQPASSKRKSASPKSSKAAKPTAVESTARGRSRQRKAKTGKSYTEEDDEDDTEVISSDEVTKTPTKRSPKGSKSKSKVKTVVAAESPGRVRGRPKSTSPKKAALPKKSPSPKQKRAPARGRRSRTSAKDEEQTEEPEGKEEKEDGGEAVAADQKADEEVGAEAVDESEAAKDVDQTAEPDDNVTAATEASPEKPDAEPSDNLQSESTASAHAEDSVSEVDDAVHVDRKRKFDEVENESDEMEEAGVQSPAKVLKVCEESDVKTAAAEAPVDGEAMSTDEVGEPSLSLPLSSDTNIEDDYVVITPDDVPPVDSDEVLNTVAKMLPGLSSAGTASDMVDTVAVTDPLLRREYVASAAVSAQSGDAARRFTLGSYNILADYHAQKDYGHGVTSWLTSEQLSLSSRHKKLMEELIYLDEDVICLQEVGGDYMYNVLQPALESLGYKGQFIARNTRDFYEGEATFYRTSLFSLESSESLLLSDLISQALDASSELDDNTRDLLKKSLSTHAVALLTRLRLVTTGDVLTVANIHVAYDKFERQDRQCLQVAATMQRLIALAGGLDKPHVICGDFNAWPGSAPYQLMSDGHLSDTSFTDLQAILTIDSGDSQLLPVVNFWSDGFQYPIGSAMKSAYCTVQGSEPISGRFGGQLQCVDYIWFSSLSLDVLGVLKAVDPQLMDAGLPSATFPSDHVSVKASFAFK